MSVATVSRVWNRTRNVNDVTRRRVEAVAAELGYSPNGAARSLITSRSNTIGVLLPDLYGEFFSEIIRGVDQAARLRGYHLLVSNSHADRQELRAALRSMRGRVDGVIVMSPDAETQAEVDALPDSLPVVVLNGATPRAHSLTIENFEGARAMVRHLVGLGHRRVAMIRGPAGNHDADERLRGFRAALAESGIAAEPALEWAGDFGEASGYAAARSLAKAAARPTAIFAANDSMAIGALSALREHGVRVPEDVAVAGFDDIPLARYMNPQLSSVHVDISAFGARATTALLDSIEDPGRVQFPVHESVPTRLAIRRSCGGDGSGQRASVPTRQRRPRS